MKFWLALLVFALTTVQVAAEDNVVDVSMAATLIGSISFIMILYYFTNWNDKDIQEATWNIICATISIFCAVLMFQSVNAVVEDNIINPLFGEEEASPGALFVDMTHMLIWFVVLQILLAKTSGAFIDGQLEKKFKEIADKQGKRAGKRAEREEKSKRHLNLKCYGVLLAHLTGFASINAWGTVQQFGWFKQSVLHALLAVPIAITGQIILQQITDHIREKKAQADDGEKSWYEEKWDGDAEEAENDVMGLTVSFLIMNSIRLGLTGCLPNQEGKEEECMVEEYVYHHTLEQKLALTGVVVVIALLLCVVIFFVELEEEEEGSPDDEDSDEEAPPEEEEEEKKSKAMQIFMRFKGCMVTALGMAFAWAFFYCLQMWLAGIHKLEGQEELLSIVLAMTLSIISFMLLVLFDRIADGDSSKLLPYLKPKAWKNMTAAEKKIDGKRFDGKTDKSVRELMIAIGFAIGFAWEQTFDKSVDAIAEDTESSKIAIVNPSSCKMFLAIFCSALLVPAWRKYILPYVDRKGWNYGYAIDLPTRLDKMSEKEGIEDEVKDKVNHHVKMLKKLIKATLEEEEKEEKEEAETREPYTAYTTLPGSGSEALERENKELRSQLLAYRKMFDTHMTNMSSNLNKIHDTMDKLQL